MADANGKVNSDTNQQPLDQATGRYGWKSFTPQCLQPLHRAKFLLVVASFCAFTQAMVHDALIPVSLTSLEKRFRLDGFALGLIVSAYDIAVLTCLVPICHFGGRGHKGRWLAGGMVVIALGSFICTIPQFISKAYKASNTTDGEVCLPDYDSASEMLMAADSRADDGEPYWLYFQLLLLGQFLNGLGSTPIYTIGVTYLDESVTHENSALFLSIFYSSSLLGVVPGFVGGGALLRIHGDVGKIDTSGLTITADDSQWYGAWWIGFLIISLCALWGALLMSGFAKKLPDAPNMEGEQRPSTAMKVATSCADLYKGIKAIFQSTTFMFLVIVEILESILSTGVINFFPKIMQSFFNISSSKASVISGATIVPAAVFGNIVGGTLVRKLKLNTPGMLVMAALVDSFSIVFGLCFLFYCPTADIAGVTRPYEPDIDYYNAVADSKLDYSAVGLPNLTNWCNEPCNCDQSIWEPVCDTSQNLTYFSPCYAGCAVKMAESGANYYLECSCLATLNYSETLQLGMVSGFNYSMGDVELGFCQKPCEYMYPFFVLFGLFVMVAFMSAIPIQESELRSVPFDERSLAYGMRWLFMRIFGTIPGPLLFGQFVDYACMVWKVDRNGNSQDCPFYDNNLLSGFIILCGLVLKLSVIGCLGMAWKYSRKHAPVYPLGGGSVREPTPVPPIYIRRPTGHVPAESTASDEGGNTRQVDYMKAPGPVRRRQNGDKIDGGGSSGGLVPRSNSAHGRRMHSGTMGRHNANIRRLSDTDGNGHANIDGASADGAVAPRPSPRTPSASSVTNPVDNDDRVMDIAQPLGENEVAGKVFERVNVDEASEDADVPYNKSGTSAEVNDYGDVNDRDDDEETYPIPPPDPFTTKPTNIQGQHPALPPITMKKSSVRFKP